MTAYLDVQFINKGSWCLSDLASYKIRNGLLTVICNTHFAGKTKKLITIIPMGNVLSIQRMPEQP